MVAGKACFMVGFKIGGDSTTERWGKERGVVMASADHTGLRKRVEEEKRRGRIHESLVVGTHSGEVPDPHRKVPRPAALARQSKRSAPHTTQDTHTHGAHKRGLRMHDKLPDNLAFVELNVCERIVVTCARDESAKGKRE
jgi:hypothetical protein